MIRTLGELLTPLQWIWLGREGPKELGRKLISAGHVELRSLVNADVDLLRQLVVVCDASILNRIGFPSFKRSSPKIC
jgi:hypothetical protein